MDIIMNEKIMVIEDEKNIADAIAFALKKEGYTAKVVYHGGEALKSLLEFSPDAIILDVMLPGMDGYDILKKIPESNRIGVIMLTAKEDIVHKILGLELGADDYITKPFDMRELLARLKSLLRRMQSAAGEMQAEDTVSLGGIVLYPQQRTAFVGDRQLDLTPKEYDLLTLLLSKPDRVYSREQLLDLVWGMEYVGGTRTVDIHVQRVRKKLGENYMEIIQTVHGIGYKALGGYSEKRYKN
jgi:two-component system, OmpR family, alkaline phosphatase synthesis response regulator PhoP